MTAATGGPAAYGAKFRIVNDNTNRADRYRRVTLTVDTPAPTRTPGKTACQVCLANAWKRR